jgi:hypothetical protein
MKAYLKPLFAAALAVTLSSCDKNAERIETLSEQSTKSISEVVYPLLGNEMSTSILPKKDNLPDATLTKDYENFPQTKIKVINSVCDEYLQQTKQFDFSFIPESKFREQIKNDDLTITFRTQSDLRGDAVIRLNNGSNGWWTHWNYSPYTQSEYPSVLFAQDKFGNNINAYSLILSNSVTMFGFEVAPNTIGEDVEVRVTYYSEDHYRSPVLCDVVQTISSPSGARLIAINSEVPFQRVAISLNGKSAGAAIANVRYKLAG